MTKEGSAEASTEGSVDISTVGNIEGKSVGLGCVGISDGTADGI